MIKIKNILFSGMQKSHFFTVKIPIRLILYVFRLYVYVFVKKIS